MSTLEAELKRRGLKPPTQTSKVFRQFQRQYKYAPAAFVRDCISFRSDGPTSYQEDILEKLPEKGRVAVRGLHGVGKTALLSWVVLWAVLTEDDCKVPTTASAWRQLTKFLWPEINKWAQRIDWKLIGGKPAGWEILKRNINRGPTCEAFAVASNNADLIEGAHAKRIVYVYDEARSIPDPTWDATEGAFSGAGEDTDAEAFAVAISTPGEPLGRFYDIHSRKPGYEDWWVRHITLEEAIEAGRVSREWAEQRARQWGEESAVYKNRVLGEFASSSEDTLIPLSWVEAAVERWKAWQDEGAKEIAGQRTLGVDIGRGGDFSAVADREGCAIRGLVKWTNRDTMESVGRVLAMDLNGREINVDVIGIGAGVVDRLREQGVDVNGVNFGAATNKTDGSGEVEMLNVRAAAWWRLRELLQPPSVTMLPDDDDLLGDLVAPRYGYTSSGKLKVESKDQIRKRLGRSPDIGDAIALAFWEPSAVQRKKTGWGW